MMKRFFVIMLACLFASAGNSQAKNFKDLIGHWDIAGEQNASLQIIDSSTIILNYLGEKKNLIDYKIDFTKSPAWFDFSTKNDSSLVKVKSLLQIVGDDIIKWQLFIDEDRPDHFSSTKGELFYLKKSNTPAAAVVSN